MPNSRNARWLVLVGAVVGLSAGFSSALGVGASVLRPSPNAAAVATTGAGEGPCEEGVACHAPTLPGGEGAAAAGPVVLGRPGLLVFSSENCSACKRMAPVLRTAEQTCVGDGDVVDVNLDFERGQSIATEYNVSMLPSFVSVDAEGHEVARLTGLQSLERIEETLEELRGKRCAKADTVEHEKRCEGL